MEEKIDLFLSNASTTMFGEAIDADELVTDKEIDLLIDNELSGQAQAGDVKSMKRSARFVKR